MNAINYTSGLATATDVPDETTGPLLEVAGDLACYCDTVRGTTRYYDEHSLEILLLSLIGPTNAVRAAWAKLVAAARSKTAPSIRIGGYSAARNVDTTYHSATAPLGRGLLHLIMYHPSLSALAPATESFYVVGPDAEVSYFDRLSRWCPIPFRSAWRDVLWERGRAANVITLQPGHGREVWSVATTRESWEPIVVDALTDGSIR